MADPEVALNVEHLEKERTWRSQSIPKFRKSEGVKRKYNLKYGGQRSRELWPKFTKSFHQYSSFLPRWKSIFIISCLASILVDPLFLYIPIINEDKKCIGLDQTLEKVTLFLRSAVDLPCIVHIIAQMILAKKPRRRHSQTRLRSLRFKLVELDLALLIAKPSSWPYFLIDISAILPIPQVVILIILTRTTGSKSLIARRFLNSLVLIQYFPRAFRMYVCCKEANKATPANENGYAIWLKVYKFIIASHVFGAIWYFSSIQREMDCWQYACRSQNGCETKTFTCGGKHTFKNVRFLDSLCPVSTPNPTVFNFGIFLDAIQSGILGSTNFPEKFLQCFWWGLRSLSSFGQNLQTSTYAWENLFALCISVSGMLLFLIYLNAILQFVTRAEELLKRRSQEVAAWLSRNDLPKYAKEVIMEIVQEKLENGIDIGLDNILSVLPSAHSNYINRYLRLAMLKKVPMLKFFDERLLKAINGHLSLERYTDQDRFIIKEDEELDKLFIITHGTVQTYKTSVTREKFGPKHLDVGDSYGSELLYWASDFRPMDELPISTRTVQPVKGAEALVLMASDLEKVGQRFWWHFCKGKELRQFTDSQLYKLEECAALAIQRALHRRNRAKKKHTVSSSGFDVLKRVPMLQITLGVRLLIAISENLYAVEYPEDTCIIHEGERLNKMIFITHGTVQTYMTNGKGGKIGSKFLEKGDFYGVEELLNWASKLCPLEDLPTSTRIVKPVTKVKAFSLSVDDLKTISIKYWWIFTKNKELSEFDITLLEELALASIEREIRRRRQGKKKRSIGSLNKLDTNQGSLSQKLQKIISKVMRDELPSPVGALASK